MPTAYLALSAIHVQLGCALLAGPQYANRITELLERANDGQVRIKATNERVCYRCCCCCCCCCWVFCTSHGYLSRAEVGALRILHSKHANVCLCCYATLPQVVATDPAEVLEDITVPKRESDISAWVNVIYGCNEKCSYCVVPYTRCVRAAVRTLCAGVCLCV